MVAGFVVNPGDRIFVDVWVTGNGLGPGVAFFLFNESTGISHLITTRLLAKYYERSRQPELAAEEWRLAEKDLRQIPDRRVRQDTETWLESHRDFRQALNPGAIK